jgi:hypothetical protein
LVDCAEELPRVNELIGGSAGTTSEVVVVHDARLRWNEELGDWDSEGVGDAVDDVDADIGFCALDP